MVKAAPIGVAVPPTTVGDIAAGRSGARAGRLVHLDGVRGYLLTMMYLVHFQAMSQGYGTSFFLALIHHGNFLPVYDAEYLVPLSGFVSALAYLGIYRSGGLRAAQVALLKRVRWLYLYQVGVGAIVILLPVVMIGTERQAPRQLLRQFLETLTFVYQPDNMQILVLFMVVMLFVPLALRALERFGPWYFAAIIVDGLMIAPSGIDASLSAWVTYHIIPWQHYFQLSGYFNPFSWGSLFYIGFLVGWLFKTQPQAFQGIRRHVMNGWLLVSLLVCAFLYIGRVGDSGLDLDGQSFFYPSRAMVSMQAIVTVAATSFIVFYLLARTDLASSHMQLRRWVDALFHFRWFVLLGQNSLFTYSMHVVMLSAMTLWLSRMPREPGQLLLLTLFAIGYATMLGTAALKRRYFPALP